MRAAGVLLSVTSLPSKYGIGSFSGEAYEFVDRVAEAGLTYWQMLPLGPTSFGDSPYQSFSTFAGNPYFIDLDELTAQGLLTKSECEGLDFGSDPRRADYNKIFKNRLDLLRLAFKRSGNHINEEGYQAFCESQRFWLEDYALFMAVKDSQNGASWDKWERGIRMRQQDALIRCAQDLKEDVEFYKYLQYLFMSQWKRLKDYANNRGIQIIGDIPVYVAYDSADAWADPELFQLDGELMPNEVAGCPPDPFSTKGQLWGNPLYRWDKHEQDGYSWWLRRISYSCRLYDVVRIDHFRGFDEYYAIPYNADTAEQGRWRKGPGLDLFHAIIKSFENIKIIAEDLGFVTESVRQLINDTGYPNMKVLQFAFDSRDTGSKNDHLPHNYRKNCVVYTGTHDNDTIAGWYKSLQGGDRRAADDYLDITNPDSEDIHWKFIRLAMLSVAELCVIPMQDYLGLGSEARMNTPSTLGDNWQWRMLRGEFTKALAGRIREIARVSGRV